MRYSIKKRNDGELIASGEPEKEVLAFEGNWYFDPQVVNMQHLKVTDRTYTCPYKGTCYWIDLEAPNTKARNIAWVYNNPKPGYEFIKDQIGFYVRTTEGTVAVQEQRETVSLTA
jgi:uncharacterized protein (DUF427 family)